MDKEGIVWYVQKEDDSNRKTRILHRNMLTSCDEIFDNFDWNIIHRKKAPAWTKDKTKKDKNTQAGKTIKTGDDFKKNTRKPQSLKVKNNQKNNFKYSFHQEGS